MHCSSVSVDLGCDRRSYADRGRLALAWWPSPQVEREQRQSAYLVDHQDMGCLSRRRARVIHRRRTGGERHLRAPVMS